MIFETERLQVCKLEMADLEAFHKLQSNPNVMRYVTGNVQSFDKDQKELESIINKYQLPNNDFWIYAIKRKIDLKFIGTVALVKTKGENEIGYRLIEEFWGFGYGFEVCKELLNYCKSIKREHLVAYVVDENHASKKIIEKLNFKPTRHFVSDDLQLPETKYELIL